jgi:hypothetical protein
MWYVYADFTTDGRPYYVGYGDHDRTYRVMDRNRFHSEIRRQFGQNRVVIQGTKDLAWAKLEEKRLICEFNTHKRTSILGTNLTTGGQGGPSGEGSRPWLKGRKQTPEHIKAAHDPLRGRSNALSGTKQSGVPKPQPKLLGRTQTLEQIERRVSHIRGLKYAQLKCGSCGALGHNRRTCLIRT